MASFLLLLHEEPNKFQALSPEEIQQIIGRYKTWREGLAQRNQLLGGEKLKDDGGRQMRSAGGEVSVTDGPYSEAHEVLGGFFMIQAADYDEAVEIARSCPHLELGQWIEVREVEQLH
jgi:hypothetical protein